MKIEHSNHVGARLCAKRQPQDVRMAAAGLRHSRAPKSGGRAAPKRSERGSISMVFIGLLAIMMILVTAESRALIHLRREVKFIEQQQIKRLAVPQTNAVTTVISEPK
jgi:hypothetical protein